MTALFICSIAVQEDYLKCSLHPTSLQQPKELYRRIRPVLLRDKESSIISIVSLTAMVPIFLLFFFCFPFNAGARCFRSLKKLQLPAVGSESYAFDSHNVGPYTGLNDGRIVKYQGPETGFVEFATTSANRSKEFCDGTDGTDPIVTLICGRAIGMEFNHKTGELYLVDANYGLMVVGSRGGLATQLAGGGDGERFDQVDSLAIDPTTGAVYIGDIGTIFQKTKNMTEILLSGDTSGRLLKYDPKTKRLTVLLRGLAMANGVAVSKDGSFVLVSEYINCRITRYWLKGPKANTSEIFVELPGNPDNIQRTESGDFWVAVNIQKLYPKLTCFALGQRFSANGEILETVNFYAEYNTTYITEVHEHLGSLYLASVDTNFVGVYKGLTCSGKLVLS